MNDRVITIIVTYNRAKLLRRVLEGVCNQTHNPERIVIVDNNSSDETGRVVDDFKTYCPVYYWRLNENAGGAGGYNYGVSKVLEEGWEFDFLWFLDDDSLPSGNCLEELLKHRREYKALVPLRISNPLNFHEFPAIRFNLKNPFLREVRDTSGYRMYGEIQNFPEVIEVEDFSFEGPLISREIVVKLGPPRADIFISGDDTDYALKIRYKLKEKIVLIKNAEVFRISEEKKEFSTPLWKEYYLRRNYYFTHREYGENFFVRIKPFFLFILSLTNDILKRRFSKERFFMHYYSLVDSFKNPMPIRYKP